jgi:hypothetical protein
MLGVNQQACAMHARNCSAMHAATHTLQAFAGVTASGTSATAHIEKF